MEIKLTKKVTIQHPIKSDVIEVIGYEESIKDKFVVARCLVAGLTQDIMLWQGEEYDKLGQWTDEDVLQKILMIFA